MNDLNDGVYVTYRTHYITTSDPRESYPPQYDGIRVFSAASELAALRWANQEGLKTVFVHYGLSLDQAIKNLTGGRS